MRMNMLLRPSWLGGFWAICVAMLLGVATGQDLGGALGVESSAASSGVSGGNAASATAGSDNPAGGGSMADFSQLMMLIQTTIEPETWEALGGTSTMFPYAAGIYVDPDGIVRDVDQIPREDMAAEIDALIAASASSDGVMLQSHSPRDWWRDAAKLRCISLKQLLDQYADNRSSMQSPDDDLLHCAGLSHVRFVRFTENDVILAGPVGGIQRVDGHWRDRSSGAAPVRLDALAACFAATSDDGVFGCSIDPTTTGLQRAAVVAQQIQHGDVPKGLAANTLASAVGRQEVSIFGINRDSSLAWLLVEADRHMKQLALGKHAMPDGATNYLDQIESHIDQGVPTDLMLRLWFTSNPLAARQSTDGSVVELAGRPIRLSGQNELAVASGRRGIVTKDPRTDAFVADFNRHWNNVRDMYPVYASLESVFQSAAIVRLVRGNAAKANPTSNASRLIADAMAAIASSDQHGFAPPSQVDTLAVSHTFRHGRQRHNVIVASGGVTVRSDESLRDEIARYPALDSVAGRMTRNVDAGSSRWWWNVATRR
ncbi:hypothetical protein Pan14r_24840 [Crateriforma conspicua]|uniref:Uncharacterized protein n=2 Tax=Crateriforma conspicua TaxID=2527996 RepID=A0A5C5Y4W9_9PLAN|nr:hypothetical protein Mal65_39500 [Crateriforma conspicua]TWT70184.1 hypothetical protein Pan14r_24840 [Crateriforma conspicua]